MFSQREVQAAWRIAAQARPPDPDVLRAAGLAVLATMALAVLGAGTTHPVRARSSSREPRRLFDLHLTTDGSQLLVNGFMTCSQPTGSLHAPHRRRRVRPLAASNSIVIDGPRLARESDRRPDAGSAIA